MTGRTNPEMLERWGRELDELAEHATRLIDTRQMFHEFAAVVRANPELQDRGSDFFDWVAISWAESVQVRVRRFVDPQNRALSLLRLLCAIDARADLVTREHCMRRAQAEGGGAKWASEQFDRLVGAGAAALTVGVVGEDVNRLRMITQKVKTFVNQRIAHHDMRRNPVVVGFPELDEAIDGIAALVRKYRTLVNGNGAQLVPLTRQPWQRIFREAWIKENPG